MSDSSIDQLLQERNSLRAELARVRAELSAVESGLEACELDLEKARKQAAAMREALKSVREMVSRYLVATKGRVSDSWLDGFIECGAVTIDGIGYIKPVPCDSDAGRDYISRERVRPLIEALEQVRSMLAMKGPGDNPHAVIREALERAREDGL